MASAYTPSQLSAFLSHISLPASLSSQHYTSHPRTDLHLLQQLHIHTISTIPYENLSLHYSPTHKISIAPATLFSKIISPLAGSRGRGGYCMENSILFHHMLRALGFPVYMSAVRIRFRKDGVPQGDFSGWVHIVNIVTLSDGSKYMLDVGFGGDGATAPLPLVEGQTHVNLGTQENRLVRDWIPAQMLRTEGSKLWIYQYRNGPHNEWNSFYAFGEVEAMEPDFYNMNFYTGSHPESFQTFTQIIVKFLRKPAAEESRKATHGAVIVETDEDQVIYGKRLLVNNVIKENLGGKTQIVQECRTESERIQALKEWFDIELTEEQKLGIRGWSTELK